MEGNLFSAGRGAAGAGARSRPTTLNPAAALDNTPDREAAARADLEIVVSDLRLLGGVEFRPKDVTVELVSVEAV